MNKKENTNNINCEKICPIVYTMNLIGHKWKIQILWNISNSNTLHYNELKRLVAPITNTVLTRCLRDLENDGLVSRFNYNTIPPSVEYSLSERGKSLFPILNEMYKWGVHQQDNR
jgi:DNA-binding HxlR family transcriptional regulator